VAATIPRIQSAITFVTNVIKIFIVIPNNLNFAKFSKDSLDIFILGFCTAFWWRRI